MGTYVKFEYGQEDRWSEVYGPFPFVQLTYSSLRVGPEGEDFAGYHDGLWQAPDGKDYSDVIIYADVQLTS